MCIYICLYICVYIYVYVYKYKYVYIKKKFSNLGTAQLYHRYLNFILQFLYDLVFEKPEPGRIGASKTHRDTLNPTRHTHVRNMGKLMTTNLMAYSPPTDFNKPSYARKPIIRDTFFR